MTLDTESKKFMIQVAHMFNENLVKQLDKNFTYIAKRFDDAEKRIESIEGRLESIDESLCVIDQNSKQRVSTCLYLT